MSIRLVVLLFFLVPGLAILSAVLSLSFDSARIYALNVLKSNCEVPAEFPPGAGALYEVDTRNAGDGQSFTGSKPGNWAAKHETVLDDLSDEARPLVIYVHGFRTGHADAVCTGEVVRAALGGIAAPGAAPDVLVFGWPTEFALHFSMAQKNAPRAAGYLGAVLDAVVDRPVILLAHSLGAAVAMETLRSGREVRVAVLVQGAIPATGLLTWGYEIETTFPAANLDDIAERRPIRRPLRDEGTGRGCFVGAAGNADRMIITRSHKDLILDRMYSRDELFVPLGCMSPRVPPTIGRPARALPQNRAIGTPIKMTEVAVLQQEMPNNVIDPDPQRRRWGGGVETRLMSNPADILMETWYEYWFENPHADFRVIALEELAGWRPLTDWHAPLAYPKLRRTLLARIWEEAGGNGL